MPDRDTVGDSIRAMRSWTEIRIHQSNRQPGELIVSYLTRPDLLEIGHFVDAADRVLALHPRVLDGDETHGTWCCGHPKCDLVPYPCDTARAVIDALTQGEQR